MGGKRRTRGEWVRLVADYKASGLGLREFAKARGLHPGTLGWWRTQLKHEPAHEVSFATVEVVRPATSRVVRVEAELPSGVRLSFEVPFERRVFGALVGALMGST